MQKRFIVGLGEALWDCLPEGSKLGGAPANFAYHTHQFGFDAIAISALGNDILGDQTRKELDQAGLNYIMPIVNYPTGTVQVTLDEEGVPTYDIKENVAWDNIPFSDEIEAVAKNARAVCFGSLAQRNSVSRDTKGLSEDFRHQSSTEFLHQGDYTRVDCCLRHSENQRRRTGYYRSTFRLSGLGHGEQMLAHPR